MLPRYDKLKFHCINIRKEVSGQRLIPFSSRIGHVK